MGVNLRRRGRSDPVVSPERPFCGALLHLQEDAGQGDFPLDQRAGEGEEVEGVVVVGAFEDRVSS